MKFLSLSTLFLFLIHCQSFKKQPMASDLSSLQRNAMNKALEFVRSGEFLKAASLYDTLAQELRGQPAEIVFLFNGGSSYRGGGDCVSSVKRYERLLDRSFNKDLFKARGLLEISYSYECLGEIKASYLSLSDISSLQNHLPKEIQIAVYPARLSLALARFQQFDKANGYQAIALNGVLQLKMKHLSEASLKKDLSRIFFNMGQIYVKEAYLKPLAFLSSFPYHQLYLLQSVFLQDDVWSPRSKKELSRGFEILQLALKKKHPETQFKEYLRLSLKEGQFLVEKEKSPDLKSFYLNLSKKILPLL